METPPREQSSGSKIPSRNATKNNGLIVLAGGHGVRFGGPKQYSVVGGKTLIEHCAENFIGFVDQVQVIFPEDAGETRLHSIAKGFERLRPCDYVFIAEAAVPNTSSETIGALIEALRFHDCAFLVSPTKWTSCKIGGDSGELEAVYHRDGMYDVHTPEALRYFALKMIVNKCNPSDGFSMLFCAVRVGHLSIATVLDRGDNIKITYKEDLYAFERMVSERKEGNKIADIS